jgi:hypothetical protein
VANKWTKQLRAYDDAVDYDYDSFAAENCLYSPSPYFNWMMANKSHGIPMNSGLLLFSEMKAGKSLWIYAMILQMQREDKLKLDMGFKKKDGTKFTKDDQRHSVVANTELRGQLQHDVFPEIDKDLMTIWDTKNPVEIFDRVEKDLKPMVQDGMPLGIYGIDSITKIMGVKRDAADSVSDHLIGDHALTVQIGMDKLVPFLKRNKTLFIGTSQVRGNMDAGKYGPKEKMAESWDVKHAFEYFVSFKRAGAAEDKVDIEGKTFEDDIKDARDNKIQTGHKVFYKMEGSSLGPQGRSGVSTLDYNLGLINMHEEIFFLGKNSGIIKTESNNRVFTFNDKKYVGKKECALAIRDNPKMAEEILTLLKAMDAKRI